MGSHVCRIVLQASWGKGYWQQDMNQRCYQGFHLTAVYAIGIPGAVLLCLGIPLATIGTLLCIRDRLDEPRTAATYGFLYHQFKRAHASGIAASVFIPSAAGWSTGHFIFCCEPVFVNVHLHVHLATTYWLLLRMCFID